METQERTGVGLALLDILPVPLSDTRSTSIREDEPTNVLKCANLPVAFDSSANLLGTGCDGELALNLESVIRSFLGDGSGARHVFVRRVGAGSDEGNLEFFGPVVLFGFCGEFGDGRRKIGGERTVDVGFEFGEVLTDRCDKMNEQMNPHGCREYLQSRYGYRTRHPRRLGGCGRIV